MAAKATPMGGVPENARPPVDVNQSEDSSHSEAVEAKPVDLADQVEDSDLELLTDTKKVPYDRFKAVNDKARSAQRELEEMRLRYESDIRRASEDAELRALARSQKEKESTPDYSSEDPWDRNARILEEQITNLKREVSSLKGETSEQRLQSELVKLENQFPEADKMAVLGWYKAKPGSSLEELMELSHSKNVERTETAIKNLLEKKKAKARQAVPTALSSIRLGSKDRPKTFKEARALMAQAMKSRGG